ncbi:protein-L-isoaspartate O-methyltransferase family protein [Glacieibacterium frigidum]|uniref:Protein-L-isoaspartate O-methyltransferase n=1 Tax=Glacieibacterium frigidum TaxID=2593303 RepID=A0A552UH20_9SPHN|nr:protein-L-isoaspartate O-methyltransferase [Glacieibacterium frigidum]TRW17510.1 protein-L-isoaspartate O-methyltransferase [Glacieibacterium frigidum]
MTDFTSLRATMVASQLRTVGVNDLGVVAAMTEVARENFVPAGRELLAYADAAVPLGGGRALVEPLVTGLQLTHARITRDCRVLVIGAGTGYATALIGLLAGRVVGVESDAALVAHAAAQGITLQQRVLTEGAPEDGPYDLIYFDGAITTVPAGLAAQLKPGGRAAAVVRQGGPGRVTVGRFVGDALVGETYIEVDAPLLPGFEKAREFVF